MKLKCKKNTATTTTLRKCKDVKKTTSCISMRINSLNTFELSVFLCTAFGELKCSTKAKERMRDIRGRRDREKKAHARSETQSFSLKKETI